MMKDPIERQDAIDACHNWDDGKDSYAFGYMVEERLKKLPSAQRWIPVSERLPKDGVEVFVYLFNPQCPYIAWVNDGCWFTEDFQVEKENYPKAWMPLPKPWKGEEG